LGFALQSFSPLRESKKTFPLSSSALALLCQTRSAWHRSSSDLIPPKKPCPLLPPGWFRSGRGLLLSWAFRPLGRSLPKNPTQSLSLQVAPLVLSETPTLRSALGGTPGVSGSSGLALSLRGGRRPVWPFSPTFVRDLLGPRKIAGYFFASGA
jgi:hypothetical protein